MCKQRQRTGGEVVNLLCSCQADRDPTERVWMHLLEDPRKRSTPRPEPPPDKAPGSP